MTKLSATLLFTLWFVSPASAETSLFQEHNQESAEQPSVISQPPADSESANNESQQQEPESTATSEDDDDAANSSWPQTSQEDEPQAKDEPQEKHELNTEELNQQARFIVNNHIPELIQDLRIEVATLHGELEIQKHQTQLLMRHLKKSKQAVHQPTDFIRYQEAFETLKSKHYQEAKIAFESFINAMPDSIYAGYSLFWLGEIERQQNQFEMAQNYFNKLLENYPQNDKVPDACYKMALMAANQKDYEQMRTWLQRILDDYPASSVARLATLKLNALTD
jgi:tol-pal system protein YbgF